jgi:energy-coupling factor transporter ATP-binding protein EcfA2
MNAPAFAFKKATKKTAKARIALMGPSGSGKSKTAQLMALGLGKKIAVIDTEHGSASKYAGDDGVEFDVLELESFSPMTYVAAIHAAEDAGYDVLIVDSLTHAWSGKGGALEQVDNAAKRSQSGNAYMAWRDVTPQHNELVDALVRCKCHLIATLRTKTDYVLEEVTRQGKTTKQPRRVGLAPIQRDGMEYEFDIVADITLDHDLIITKTRCTALDGAVINKAGEAFGRTIRDWLSDGEAPALPKLAPVANANAERPASVPPPAAAEDPHAGDKFPKRWPHENGSWADRPMSSAPFEVLVKFKFDMREAFGRCEHESKAATAALDLIEKASYWVQKKNPDPTGALPMDGNIPEHYFTHYFDRREKRDVVRAIRELAPDMLGHYVDKLEKEALLGREQAERVHFYLLAARRVLGQHLAAEIEAEEAANATPAEVVQETMSADEAASAVLDGSLNVPEADHEKIAEWLANEGLPPVAAEPNPHEEPKKAPARTRLGKRATADLATQLKQATGKQ